MPHRCTTMDSQYYLQRPLKDPIPSECRALSLLFYSIRRVFFCFWQAPGFNFRDIEFHWLLSPPSPGYWKCVAIVNCSPHLHSSPGHGEFGSAKALHQLQLFFNIILVLAPGLVRNAPLCFPWMNSLLLITDLSSVAFSAWVQSGVNIFSLAFWVHVLGDIHNDRMRCHFFLANSDNTLEILVLVNLLRPALH